MAKIKDTWIKFVSERTVKKDIDECEKYGHLQQVVYSVHHKALTQICFTCNCVITSLNPEPISKEE